MNNLQPSEDPNNYKWGMFYYNPADKRIIVPKKIKWFGWTFNFARPESYLIILIFVIVVFVIDKYKVKE